MEPPSTVDPRLEPLVDLGNIGSLEATVSLSRLATESVNISVGRVDLLPMAPLESLLGGSERMGVMVVLDTVEVRGKVSLLFPMAGAAVLARLLQAGDNLSSPVAQSALGEVGNILAHAYLNAFSGVLRRTLTVAPPPQVAVGSPALLQALLPSGPFATLHIEARVASNRGEVPLHLYFLLDPQAIGPRNILAVQKKLSEMNIPITGAHVGGRRGRTIEFDTGSGKVWVRTADGKRMEI